jgi:hypothetical protein
MLARPMVRPWALSVPVLVLLIGLPMLRPLRHPDPRDISDDERARLLSVQALAEGQTLALDKPAAEMPRSNLIRNGETIYSDQPPVMAILLAGPYWLMTRMGLRMDDNPNLVAYLLTLLGVTLPVALGGGMIYRMGRLFELARPVRAALGAIVVFGSGLISYAVVLNSHAPSAVLLLASASGLIHVAVSGNPAAGGGWVLGAGFTAALAMVIEPTAAIFAVLFACVPLAMRWKFSLRLRGVLAYLIGMVPPVFFHAALMVSGASAVTGDLLPGMFHPELAYAVQGDSIAGEGIGQMADLSDDADPAPVEEAGRPVWRAVWDPIGRVLAALLGPHGLLSHFPVVVMGLFGTAAIMHRHWPTATKFLAAGTVLGAVATVLILSLATRAGPGSMFAARWFVLFVPLLLFWSGAWLRRGHRASSWTMAGLLLVFSVSVSLLGMTDPLPRRGYGRYTPVQALGELLGGTPNTARDDLARPLLARQNDAGSLP